MLREHRRAVAHEAKGRLEVRAIREQRRGALESGRKPDDRGRKSAGTPQQADLAADRSHHRIVDAVGNAAIVEQRIRGDAGEPRVRVLVARALRLLGEIAAGHDHRPREPAQHERVQRRGRQHEAERAQSGCDGVGQALRAIGLEQDDGRGGAGQRRFLLGAHGAEAADDVEIARHQGKGPGLALLQLPQAFDDGGIGRVAGEVESAQPLDGDDLALLDERAGGVDVVEHRVLLEVDRAAVEPLQARLRAAAVTGGGLGVEPPVGRVAILLLAGGAEIEAPHGRLRAIVGDGLDDGQPRAAVRAGGEGIAVAPGEGIGDLLRAGGAHRRVGCDLGAGGAVDALDDVELQRQRAFEGARLDRFDVGERRRLALEPLQQKIDGGARPAHADEHALRVVVHFARKREVAREPPDGGPEPDALDAAAHADLESFGGHARSLG